MKYGIVLALVLGASGTARADNQNKFVAYSNLPASVKNAANKAVSNANWLLAVQRPDGWYAILGRDKTNHLVEFRYEPAKSRGYFRTVITESEVPAVAMSALKARCPNFRPSKIHAVGIDSKKIQGYRFEGLGLEANNNCVYVGTDGQKVFQAKE